MYNLQQKMDYNPPIKSIINAVRTSNLGNEIFEISKIIHPNLIIFDKIITKENILEFISRIKGDHLPNFDLNEKSKYIQMISLLASELITFNPITRIFVSKSYSVNRLAGFFTIPYNFDIKNVMEFWGKNKKIINQKAKEIVQLNMLIKNRIENLRLKYGIEIDVRNKEPATILLAISKLESMIEKDETFIHKFKKAGKNLNKLLKKDLFDGDMSINLSIEDIGKM